MCWLWSNCTHLSLHSLEAPTSKHPSGISLYHTHSFQLLSCFLAHQVTSTQSLELNHTCPGGLILLHKLPAPEKGLQALKTQHDLTTQEKKRTRCMNSRLKMLQMNKYSIVFESISWRSLLQWQNQIYFIHLLSYPYTKSTSGIHASNSPPPR